MKTFWTNRRITFGVTILLSIIIVFFIGWTFDKDTFTRNLTVTPDGVTHFRKGLDISG
jgi:hypothetical protein